jgi:hypothetical protein
MRFGIAAAAVALGVLGGPAYAIVGAGKAAPAWSGKTTAGKPLSSAKLKGKVVLLNFFNNY